MSNLLANYIDNFFDDSVFRPIYQNQKRYSNIPAINIKEHDQKYEITVTVPGLDAEDIDIEITDNALKISYDHTDKNEEKDEDGQTIREEYSHYSFARSIILPNNVDKKSIKANTKKGILYIDMKKLPEAQPTKIKIENSEQTKQEDKLQNNDD